MVQTVIHMTEEQAEALRRVAAERGVSPEEVIRRGIDQYLALGEAPLPEAKWARAKAAAGRFRADVCDLSTRHDERLTESH